MVSLRCAFCNLEHKSSLQLRLWQTTSTNNYRDRTLTVLYPAPLMKALRDEYPVIPAAAPHAHVKGDAAFDALYARSLADPAGFWAELAREHLDWLRDFSVPTSGSLSGGDAAWFLGGALNASVNCIDRHVATRGDKPAIIWESDEVGVGRIITFAQLQAETCRVANAMVAAGIRKGDTVAIYMPMIPETAFVMLACCRIGAVHRLACVVTSPTDTG